MRLSRAAAALAITITLAGAGLAATGAIADAASGHAAAAAASGARALPAASGVGSGYWHTSGNQILDSSGNPVRIAGINWYGFETPDEIAHGLWAQDYHAIINDIKSLGYNTIRIPFSNQMVESPIVPQNLSFYNTGPINTDLSGLNSLQVLDKIIAYAGQAGLKVILDDHRSEAGESAEANGLWYTSAYPASAWVNDWATLAKRYAGNPTVVGFDLRNEPHTPTGDTYAQGATWGTGDPNTDVRLAYEQAGNAILAADPNALIFCEGVSENPTSAGGYNSTWWGGDLAEAGQYPVTLSSPGHVVYSAHDYGPNLFQQTWFNSSTTPASLDAVWNANWGYLYSQNIAPVWVGRVRHRQHRGRRVQHRGGLAGPVVLQPGRLPQGQPGDGLDVLGAERRGLLRPAGRQLRPHPGERGQAGAAGHHRVPAARRGHRLAVADPHRLAVAHRHGLADHDRLAVPDRLDGRRGVLPCRLLADQYLVGRLPGADRAQRHRQHRDQPVDAHLHLRR